MSEENGPRFEFFTHLPADLLSRPPLASSLQSFESHLFLLALRRYPHAFTSCVFAVESAIKAGLAIGPRDRVDLQELIKRTRQRVPAVAALPEETLDEVRKARNRIVHYGFSPADDSVSASLLLGGALPLLDAVYAGYFGFSLLPSLLPPVEAHIRASVEFFALAKEDPLFRFQVCSDGLAHWVRRAVGDAAQSGAEAYAADRGRTIGLEGEEIKKTTDALERALEPSWLFDCPVCNGPDAFVVQLDFGEEAQSPTVRVLRGVCAACDLSVPAATPSLAHHLCAAQVLDETDRILRDYGLTRP